MITFDDFDTFDSMDQSDRHKVYIPESITTAYPIRENKEPVINVLDLCNKQKIKLTYEPPKEIQLIKQPLKLRVSAATLLLKAAKKLPVDISFKVSEGYRPIWYQKQEFNKIKKQIEIKNPTLSNKQLWNKVTQFIADPDLTPPHSTGGAIDLTLIDSKGNELDMGCSLNTISNKAYTHYKKVTKKQKENRLLLFNTMISVGFANLASEWWHYSYGDQYWAVMYKKKHAVYDTI